MADSDSQMFSVQVAQTLKASILRQINMEANRWPHVEDGGLVMGPSPLPC